MSDLLTTLGPAESTLLPRGAEVLLVILITLAGLGLRSAHPSRLAVAHFDEGVYASNLFFHDKAGTGHYPDQRLYAPPLLPFLIECSMIVFGTANWVPMVVNIAAGALTAPALWWLGRRWFGQIAGLAAATLAALSDVHIFFSRTALTDVLLCFLLIGAVYFLHRALPARRRLALFAAGTLTGLAWWTKYTGWLPLAIALAGLVPWVLLGSWHAPQPGQSRWLSLRQGAGRLPRPLARWSIAALIAFLIWLPWLVSLQEKGGYSAVAANHQGYVLGISEWTNTFAMQARKLSRLDGLPTGCSLLAVLAVSIVSLRLENRRFTWNMLLWNDVLFFALPVVVLVGVMGAVNIALMFLGAVGTCLALGRRLSNPPGDTEPAGCGLAAWMLTAWFVGLLFTTFLYMPYPRLALPLLLASWLGVGILADALADKMRSHANELLAIEHGRIPLLALKRPNAAVLARVRPVFVLAIGSAIFLSAMQQSPLTRSVPGWESRTGLADLAPTILDDACRDAGLDRQTQLNKLIIYTYGEPALVYNLRRAGADFVNPVKDVSFANPKASVPPLPSFVIIGPQAWRTPGFGEQMAKALPRLKLEGHYRYHPSDLVVLDDSLIRSNHRTEHVLDLYRVK
jgi:4-amino-4-deoxy-L-arabinose transferase-like glycosyltransferase